MARSTARALFRVSSASDWGTEVEHNAGSGTDGSNTFLHVGGTDDDAVSRSPWAVKAHRAAVAAAAFTFGGGNQLHGADLRRAAEGAIFMQAR